MPLGVPACDAGRIGDRNGEILSGLNGPIRSAGGGRIGLAGPLLVRIDFTLLESIVGFAWARRCAIDGWGRKSSLIIMTCM